MRGMDPGVTQTAPYEESGSLIPARKFQRRRFRHSVSLSLNRLPLDLVECPAALVLPFKPAVCRSSLQGDCGHARAGKQIVACHHEQTAFHAEHSVFNQLVAEALPRLALNRRNVFHTSARTLVNDKPLAGVLADAVSS